MPCLVDILRGLFFSEGKLRDGSGERGGCGLDVYRKREKKKEKNSERNSLTCQSSVNTGNEMACKRT